MLSLQWWIRFEMRFTLHFLKRKLVGIGELLYISPEELFALSFSQRTLNQSVMAPASPDLIRTARTYDAFQEDIAVVHFYFETQTVLQFSTTATQGICFDKSSHSSNSS